MQNMAPDVDTGSLGDPVTFFILILEAFSNLNVVQIT